MAITLTERVDSRESTTGLNRSIILHYILEGTADDMTAKRELLAATPTIYDYLTRGDVRVLAIWVNEDTDEGAWDCTVPYVSNIIQPGDYTTSFDTTGGTQHISHIGEYGSDDELRTISKWPPEATDYHGAIGVTGDGADMTAEGVDVVAPIYQWTEVHNLPDSVVTPEYRQMVFVLTGRFNQDVFREFLPGEVLFMGGVGDKHGLMEDGQSDWQVAFSFAAQLTVGVLDERITVARPEKMTIGDIVVTQKYGWDYLWAHYRRTPTASQMGVKADGAYVERVCRPGDFNWLQIGA